MEMTTEREKNLTLVANGRAGVEMYFNATKHNVEFAATLGKIKLAIGGELTFFGSREEAMAFAQSVRKKARLDLATLKQPTT